MYWIFGMKFVDLEDSCTVGGDPAMNIIITRVPVLNAPEEGMQPQTKKRGAAPRRWCALSCYTCNI